MYQVVFSKGALKQLKNIAKTRPDIKEKIEALFLYVRENPRILGKPLKGVNLWRYRVGDYRAIVSIKDEIMVLKALRFAHRKDVYKNLDELE